MKKTILLAAAIINMVATVSVPVSYSQYTGTKDMWLLIAAISFVGALSAVIYYRGYLSWFKSHELNNFNFFLINFRKRYEWERFDRWLYTTNQSLSTRYDIADDNISYLYLIPGFSERGLAGPWITTSVIFMLRNMYTVKRTVFDGYVHYENWWTPEVTK